MEKKGYMLHEDVAGITYYVSVHPEILLKSLQDKSHTFEQALPELLAIANSFSDIKGELSTEQPRRSPLNSQSLQEKFPQVYESFWNSHQHIFSGHGVFTR
ncbi:MAG: hypothetical protein LBU27_05645 [Candidatus Peribacteria bacterium]|nr:hypothetical protein [Candidatus Peribacteria bacterium]